MPQRSALLTLLAALLLLTAAHAENIVFPDDAGVIDLSKEPYNAVGDGKTDNTAALQKAVDELRGRNFTFYLPDGEYLISGSVGIFDGKPHSRDRFISWQGQSEAGTIIKLKDKAEGFGDAEKPKTVLSVYEGKGTGDVMHSYVRNLTVDVGSGNPGATGLRFFSNNTGAMERVTIRSSAPDHAGAVGLDLSQGQNGPALIKRVTVEGFDTGVTLNNTFAMVVEHLTLKNQRKLGFDNGNGRLTLRGLKSDSKAPAFKNGKHGQVTLVEAELNGNGTDATAITTPNGKVFLRDVQVKGFAHTLQPNEGGPIDGDIAEWHGMKAYSLFAEDGADLMSLRLPIEETPDVPWEQDMSKWIKVDKSGGRDVTQQLQAAIDEGSKHGATTIYFPKEGHKTDMTISGPIRVHGSINRIIGLSAIVDIKDPDGVFKPVEGENAPPAVFTFDNLDTDAVVVERFFLLGGWDCPSYVTLFENKSPDTAVVLKNLNHRGSTKRPQPGQRWYLEDFSPSRQTRLEVGKDEKMWARQLNTETPKSDMTHTDGGQLWILGLKTEGRTSHAIAVNDAKVEVLGGVSYQSWKGQERDPPVFVVTDSECSFTIGFYHYNLPFTTIVSETRDGETRTLSRKELDGYHLPLYRASGGDTKP